MARVFLTGASGFLGRRVVRELSGRGHTVTSLLRQPDGGPRTITGDITDPSTWGRQLPGHDVIVHLAAVTGRAPRPEYGRVNVGGTRALLQAAHHAEVPRFLFCSTIATTFADIHAYPYAQSKVAAEALVRQSGLRTSTFRPTMIGGPESPVVTRLAALSAMPIVPLFGGGRARVQPIHVDDLAALVADSVERGAFEGEVLDFGGRDVVTMRELLGTLRRLQGRGRGRLLPVPMRFAVPAVGLAESLLGPSAPITLGQLSTFRFDGVARANPLWTARRERLATLERVLTTSSAS